MALASNQITLEVVDDGKMLYATCSTAASTAAKVATLSSGTLTLEDGATIAATFDHENTAANATLKIGSTDAKTIKAEGSSLTSTSIYNWTDGATVIFVYDGTYWQMDGTAPMKRASDAKKTATSYITDVTNGVYVHANNTPADPTDASAKGVRITDEIDIIRGGESMVNISNSIKVGKGNKYVRIDDSGMGLFTQPTGYSKTLAMSIDEYGIVRKNPGIAKYNGSSSSSTTVSLSSGTITQVSLSNKVLSSTSEIQYNLNNGGIEVYGFGVYRINASVYVNAAAAATHVDVFVRRDDSAVIPSHSWSNATEIGSGQMGKGSSATALVVQTSFIVEQLINDTVTYFLGVRSSNGTGTLYTGNNMTFLEIEYLGNYAF